MTTITLTFINSSYLRLQPKAVADLPQNQVHLVPQNTKVGILGYKQEVGLYIRTTFNRSFDGRNTWLVYTPHIRMFGTEPTNKPKDNQPDSNRILGRAIQLPGNRSLFYLNQPIVLGGNFTWGEATHGGTRIPESPEVVRRMLFLARALQEVRQQLGNRPIQVRSWYRPPAINRAVGGATDSRHLYGDAVDFAVQGISPYDVYDRLDRWWGDRGGLASSSVFTHIDARGWGARWDYGF
ncbi:DUF882 domain-containing protein [Phormidium tenue FACHB-886]|nr:DUF882 domain-containing protein [Phormidium tenue FACHB-886]